MPSRSLTVAAAPEIAPRPRRRAGVGRVLVTAVTVAVVLLLAAHAAVPQWDGLGSGLDSTLPWDGLLVAGVAIAAVLVRGRVAMAVAAVGLITWATMFGPTLLRHAAAGPHDLRIVSLNVSAANQQPRAAIQAVAADDPDVVVLEELTGDNVAAADAVLDQQFRYEHVAGTVGVWSKLPLSDTGAVDIGIGWTRGLRTTVATADGAVRVYAVHLASARPGETGERDHTLAALAALVKADPAARLVVAGDLNTATTDRRLTTLAPLRDTQTESGAGFGFTFPARFPLIRPDHILQRGMRATGAWVLRAPGSDHRAVVADLA